MSLPETDARDVDLADLKVCVARGCRQCSHDILITGPGKEPHRASLTCVRCGRHCGWLSAESAAFISEIIEHFGRPTEPIEVRKGGGNRLSNIPGVA
jgi:hypothetical protein